MSKKNHQNIPTKTKTQITNTNKNMLEKIKYFFKILAFYIAPIISAFFCFISLHPTLSQIDKINFSFFNNTFFYSVILLVAIFFLKMHSN